jgi:uncharacterized protein YndB with AHSA1/START domain
MCRPVHHEVTLPASPADVYRAYMTSREHAKFTGSSAHMSSRIGGAFSCGDDSIRGINVDLVPGKRIVQAWRLSHWKEGVYSLVTFSLRKKGKGTLLTLDHLAIPAEEREEIDDGWTTYDWNPLQEYFG